MTLFLLSVSSHSRPYWVKTHTHTPDLRPVHIHTVPFSTWVPHTHTHMCVCVTWFCKTSSQAPHSAGWYAIHVCWYWENCYFFQNDINCVHSVNMQRRLNVWMRADSCHYIKTNKQNCGFPLAGQAYIYIYISLVVTAINQVSEKGHGSLEHFGLQVFNAFDSSGLSNWPGPALVQMQARPAPNPF